MTSLCFNWNNTKIMLPRIRFIHIFVSMFIWAQGGWIGYFIHCYIFNTNSEIFSVTVQRLIETQASTLIYIGVGTTLFFSIFGVVIGCLWTYLLGIAKKLEKANKLKDQFLAACSHDLKSPLTGIIGYSEVLLLDKSLQGETREFVQSIHSSGKHLLHIISDILALRIMQLETQSIKLLTKKNVEEMISSVVETHRPLAESKGIRLTFSNSADLFFQIMGDAHHLALAIGNLISNSIKFTPRGGSVLVSVGVSMETSTVVFQISDTGIGIPKKQISKLMYSSSGFSRKGTNNEESTGIGLEVVKQVAHEHDAILSVESEEGRGTTFYLSCKMVVL